MIRRTMGALTGAFFLLACVAFSDALGPSNMFAGVVTGASHTFEEDSAPPPEALLASQALVLYQGGTAARDSVTLPDSADLALSVRAFKNGVATNGYSAVAWLNYTTGALSIDSTAGKRQRAQLHRRATFDPGWVVAVSKIGGVQVRDSVYVRDAANPVPHDTVTPPPPDSVPPVDTVVPPPPPDTVTPPPPPPPPDTTTVAELPRSVPTFTFPAPTRTRAVSVPMDLQAALSATVPGDELVLSGAWTGEFRLPVLCDPAKWVTIRSAGTLPPEGVRARPSTSGGYAKIIAPTTYPAAALFIQPGTCNVRLLGLEIAHTPATGATFLNYGLLLVGDGGWTGGGETQTTLAKVPRNIVLDRMYIHGTPTSELVRCVSLNGANAMVVNSWIDDCHASGFDSQAIEGWNTPGPVLIENNTLIGAGENVMFGGADPGIYGLVPMDITIRRNHFYKPLSWKTSSPRWSVKNLFELKNAGRVLLEANVLENSWPASQEGMAIVIKSSHDACGSCTWQGTQDLTIRYNIVRNAAVGINLQAVDGESDRHVARVQIEQNLIHDIGPGGRSALLMFTHDLRYVTVTRNTIVHGAGASGLVLPMAYSWGAAVNLVLTNNLLTATAGYAFHNSDNGSVHSNALRAMAGTSWTVAGNVIAGMAPDFVSQNPAGNLYPAALGLLADYSLPASSPFAGKGADVAEVQRRTAGVVVSP